MRCWSFGCTWNFFVQPGTPLFLRILHPALGCCQYPKGLPCADLCARDAQEAVDPELDHDKYLYDMRNFSGAATPSQDPEMQVR